MSERERERETLSGCETECARQWREKESVSGPEREKLTCQQKLKKMTIKLYFKHLFSSLKPFS